MKRELVSRVEWAKANPGKVFVGVENAVIWAERLNDCFHFEQWRNVAAEAFEFLGPSTSSWIIEARVKAFCDALKPHSIEHLQTSMAYANKHDTNRFWLDLPHAKAIAQWLREHEAAEIRAEIDAANPTNPSAGRGPQRI
jgi:hypothetical protein